ARFTTRGFRALQGPVPDIEFCDDRADRAGGLDLAAVVELDADADPEAGDVGLGLGDDRLAVLRQLRVVQADRPAEAEADLEADRPALVGVAEGRAAADAVVDR